MVQEPKSDHDVNVLTNLCTAIAHIHIRGDWSRERNEKGRNKATRVETPHHHQDMASAGTSTGFGPWSNDPLQQEEDDRDTEPRPLKRQRTETKVTAATWSAAPQTWRPARTRTTADTRYDMLHWMSQRMGPTGREAETLETVPEVILKQIAETEYSHDDQCAEATNQHARCVRNWFYTNRDAAAIAQVEQARAAMAREFATGAGSGSASPSYSPSWDERGSASPAYSPGSPSYDPLASVDAAAVPSTTGAGDDQHETKIVVDDESEAKLVSTPTPSAGAAAAPVLDCVRYCMNDAKSMRQWLDRILLHPPQRLRLVHTASGRTYDVQADFLVTLRIEFGAPPIWPVDAADLQAAVRGDRGGSLKIHSQWSYKYLGKREIIITDDDQHRSVFRQGSSTQFSWTSGGEEDVIFDAIAGLFGSYDHVRCVVTLNATIRPALDLPPGPYRGLRLVEFLPGSEYFGSPSRWLVQHATITYQDNRSQIELSLLVDTNAPSRSPGAVHEAKSTALVASAAPAVITLSPFQKVVDMIQYRNRLRLLPRHPALQVSQI